MADRQKTKSFWNYVYMKFVLIIMSLQIMYHSFWNILHICDFF